METFFSDADYYEYLHLMAEWCNRCNVDVWSYCLMPNHIHMIVVPKTEDGLRRAVGEAHRRYTRYINFQKNWRGHLWQGRFASFPMDEQYTLATARYVELNPVAAGMARRAEDYGWSSAKAHLCGEDDILVKVNPLLAICPNWQELLLSSSSEEEYDILRQHERTGRPLGAEDFLDKLEAVTSRTLKKQKPGPKKNN